jgi:acyl-CoA thioesterase I
MNESLVALNRRHFSALALSVAGMGLFSESALAQSKAKTIVVVGDSLSAEYGLRRGTGWVALLEKRLAEQKITAKVINASISGDTTSGGRSRLPALLTQHKPTHVIIELGGNDALRGLPLKMTEDNLSAMTEASQKAGAQVLLVGMQVPPNYGADYSAKFASTFETVAKTRKTQLVPFFLKGVADGASSEQALKLFQADRIHPKEEAHPFLLDNVWPTLRKML